jgi:hypothetical protein
VCSKKSALPAKTAARQVFCRPHPGTSPSPCFQMSDIGIEIQKLKIAVTSDCCLSCSHCGVDKTLGAKVPSAAAHAAVRALLSSPGGRGKRLELYGGEPFLEFDLLSGIVLFARRLARRVGRALSISVASNGLLLQKEHLDFLRKNGISLSISFSGSAATHDHTRMFPGGRGSFSAVKSKLPLILSMLDRRDIVALDCVHPRNAARAAADFKALARQGFRVINVECVHGPRWSSPALAAFTENMAEICAFVELNIRRRVFIYPEPLVELARSAGVAASVRDCPFYRDLELYPDGAYAFYPYAFIKYSRDIDKVRIGTARRGFSGRFSDCRPGDPACRSCVSSYYRLPELLDGSTAYRAREAAFRRLFLSVIRKARYEAAFRAYVAGVFSLVDRSYSDGAHAS